MFDFASYHRVFEVPEKFRGKQVNLVFEASMTDTEVKVNGRKVGSKMCIRDRYTIMPFQGANSDCRFYVGRCPTLYN